MTTVKWEIHKLDDGVGRPPIFALIPDDETTGIVIGEVKDVRAVVERLSRFVETGQHDGEIEETDRQLGAKWLTASEASRDWGIPQSSITWACRQGLIREAEKGPRGWEFPQRHFLAWLNHRPGRGRWGCQTVADKTLRPGWMG